MSVHLGLPGTKILDIVQQFGNRDRTATVMEKLQCPGNSPN